MATEPDPQRAKPRYKVLRAIGPRGWLFFGAIIAATIVGGLIQMSIPHP